MIKNDIKVWLIKQMLIALLCVAEFSGTKFMSLNNETYMARPPLIDLNLFELKYFPFMISLGLDKCSGSCTSVNDINTCSK